VSEDRFERRQAHLYTLAATVVVTVLYAAAMILTNTHFTLLDDESTIIAVAGRPVLSMLKLFLTGTGQHEHPPLSDILLHGWLLLTGYSFFALRIFANLFYIAAAITTAVTAGRLAGKRGYWFTLLLALTWPFAFQYGRIAGWYCVTMALVAWVTKEYLALVEDGDRAKWVRFCVASVLLVWTNYFGLVILVLLCIDLVVFHREILLNRLGRVLVAGFCVTVSFVPLVRAAMLSAAVGAESISGQGDLKSVIASVGYPLFSLFGSAAVAPWYLPLSIPVAMGAVALVAAVWMSRGRRWLVYFAAALVLLTLSGHITIKRIAFLLPWFFLAIGLAATSERAVSRRLAEGASALLVICGFAGIVSGQHYSTSNLYEPWGRAADVVARDARQGATIVSVNAPFFLYLNYRLGLEREMSGTDGPNAGQSVYRMHGYRIFKPDSLAANEMHGKVVLANGSAPLDYVATQEALDATLQGRCQLSGEYHDTPDPAATWKQQYAKSVPVVAYRVQVKWYDCPL
jgi:Dolichyl-phosphate-mannose-protein mannosyltransferase